MISRVKAEDLLVNDLLVVGRANHRITRVIADDGKVSVMTKNGPTYTFLTGQLVAILPDDDAGTEYIKKGHHLDEDL
jgi:hypothetical protein